MTLISAIIHKRGIAVATDSMLTAVKDNKNIYIEWEQPKIIPVPKLRACMSYWGYAGSLKEIPKLNDEPIWIWSTYDFLKKAALNPHSSTLEDFSNHICAHLESDFNRMGVADRGIGVHITGIETIDGINIPELFLVTNWKGIPYMETREFDCSRHTYHTLKDVACLPEHREKKYRMEVNDFLNTTGNLVYNNGDPYMFNIIANATAYTIQLTRERGKLRPLETLEEVLPTIKLPIEYVSKIQKNFYHPDKRLVGGRIHDLIINDDGTMSSTSGDFWL